MRHQIKDEVALEWHGHTNISFRPLPRVQPACIMLNLGTQPNRGQIFDLGQRKWGILEFT